MHCEKENPAMNAVGNSSFELLMKQVEPDRQRSTSN